MGGAVQLFFKMNVYYVFLFLDPPALWWWWLVGGWCCLAGVEVFQ
jgi:hypothetical protein